MRIATILNGPERRQFADLLVEKIDRWVASGFGTRSKLAKALRWPSLSRLAKYQVGALFPAPYTVKTIAENIGDPPVTLLHAAGFLREVIYLLARLANHDEEKARDEYRAILLMQHEAHQEQLRADWEAQQAERRAAGEPPLMYEPLQKLFEKYTPALSTKETVLEMADYYFRPPRILAAQYAIEHFRLRGEESPAPKHRSLDSLHRRIGNDALTSAGLLEITRPRLPRLLRFAVECVGLDEVPENNRRFLIAAFVRAWADTLTTQAPENSTNERKERND